MNLFGTRMGLDKESADHVVARSEEPAHAPSSGSNKSCLNPLQCFSNGDVHVPRSEINWVRDFVDNGG